MPLQSIPTLGHFPTACCVIWALLCGKIALLLMDWLNSKFLLPVGRHYLFLPCLGPSTKDCLVCCCCWGCASLSRDPFSLLPFFASLLFRWIQLVIRWPISLHYQQNDLGSKEPSTPGDSCNGLGFPMIPIFLMVWLVVLLPLLLSILLILFMLLL